MRTLYLPLGTSTSFLQATGTGVAGGSLREHGLDHSLAADIVRAVKACHLRVLGGQFAQFAHHVHEDVGAELVKSSALGLGGWRLSKPLEGVVVGLAEAASSTGLGAFRLSPKTTTALSRLLPMTAPPPPRP